MESTLKNLLLAGIGTIAYTYEKGASLIDDMVKKGELTVSQGKQLNEELKRKTDHHGKDCSNKGSLTVEALKEAILSLDLATKKDIEELKQRVEKLENK